MPDSGVPRKKGDVAVDWPTAKLPAAERVARESVQCCQCEVCVPWSRARFALMDCPLSAGAQMSGQHLCNMPTSLQTGRPSHWLAANVGYLGVVVPSRRTVLAYHSMCDLTVHPVVGQ